MKNLKLTANQTGLVSFFVVTIIMIVISMIVLAFSQLARREQQQTLDRQLSTQAYYAAESGVNDAIDALSSDPSLLSATWPSDCSGFINTAGLDPDLGDGITYSCLLVDTSPPELNYSSVPTKESVVANIKSEGGAPITDIAVSWEDFEGETLVSGCPDPTSDHSFPGSIPADCLVGALRLELVPFGQPRSRDQLISDRFIAFAQPRGGFSLGTTSYPNGNGDNQGVKSSGGCDSSGGYGRFCTLRISGLPSANQYYLRMRSMYRPTAVTIRAYTSSFPGGQVNLVGSQAEIDVTGRSTDVLRRIKVSAPFRVEGSRTPEFAIQSLDTICKRFTIAPAPASGGTSELVAYSGTGANSGECDPTE